MSLSLPQRRINIRLMDTRQAEIGPFCGDGYRSFCQGNEYLSDGNA